MFPRQKLHFEAEWTQRRHLKQNKRAISFKKPPYFYVYLNYFVSNKKSQGARVNSAGSDTCSFVK